jgi:hypothetical protein
MIAPQYGLVAKESTRLQNLPCGLLGSCCRYSTVEGKVGRPAKLLTKNKARRIAVNIAKLPELLKSK